MSKKTETPEVAPLPFAVGEKVRFCPVNGDKDQDAEILALPTDGVGKYLCQLEFCVVTINACYLKKL